jgi:hypothetical protein
VRKLNRALGEALEDSSLKTPLENNGVILQAGPPEALTALRGGIPALAKIMRENGIRITGG